MLVYATLAFATVAAAFNRNAHPEGIYKRSALSSMNMKDAAEICGAGQTLVCCDTSEQCGAVQIGGK